MNQSNEKKITACRKRIVGLENENRIQSQLIKSQKDLIKTLEEEKGKNLKLKAQINRDYENSSIPSSKSVEHRKISNSTEKTGKRPGGQPGHEGHRRKKQMATSRQDLLPPQEVLTVNKRGRNCLQTCCCLQSCMPIVQMQR